MKLLREYIREILKEQKMTVDDIETYGDLKKLIKYAQSAKRAEIGTEAAKDWVKDSFFDEILGKIPGAATARNAAGVLKAMYTQPDESRTGTALDALDVDDDVSAIVDDPIENAFLKQWAEFLESKDDNKPLSDVNVTKSLNSYLEQQFNKRKFAGFEE